MKVGELIEKLQLFNREAEVVCNFEMVANCTMNESFIFALRCIK